MSALGHAVDQERGITVTRDDPAVAVSFEPTRVRVQSRAGRTINGRVVVLAAGAWSAGVEGLPRALPVTPLKGQMLAVRSTCLGRSIAGDDVYLVPRGDEIVVGATVEEAGFDLSIDESAIESLREKAVELCPALADAPVVRRWAGIRPATPDRLPILGPDPFERALIYACGHSKNGILLAPETAAIVARLALGEPPERDISRFSVTRFMQSHIE
jgi:glycine/D-amino acid oxidase-like deaminating enzyme